MPRGVNKIGWRRIVLGFGPSWFVVTMGTGIVAILLAMLPFQAKWLYYLSIIVFLLNVVLFVLAAIVTIMRYALYPRSWSLMMHNPVDPLYLATCPIGFATLIEMWVFICVPAWGYWATTLAWVLWMIDTAVSVVTTLSITFLLLCETHTNSLDQVTAVQIIPIAATVVAAGVGAEISADLSNITYRRGTIIACYLPPKQLAMSCFLTLGPVGFGGFVIMYLGKVSLTAFDATNSFHPLAGEVAYVMGLIVALGLWGFSLLWLVIAFATIFRAYPIPFNMSWWSTTFPFGVFCINTIQIGKELESMFFKVFGTIFSVVVILFWMVTSAGTLREVWRGKVFHVPYLDELMLEGEESYRDTEHRAS
ncbi:hypothetical protein P170DRAFT_464414 [Aspergillus steynii IBT 23096]|uniref:C4-dicarboxylate transporter/malic acid transport protein n=1 Tax=Aspergillus steynii IBT 23096 TaxID=1392250 RepID=A0A2I2G7E3_9EURO|nr:uncharacterized protein P170DRAFT_464414 [Aspergillus steynii IBT 23096]PLB48809.1 hypothetical protein P170DRAFT_464414 [Aspergillus steynii IBT 23096]